MKLEKGVISDSQLMYMIIAFLQSAALTIGFAFSLTKQSTWITVLIAFAIVVPVALMHTTIAKKYLGKNLVQINDAVFGIYFGKVISAIYIWYFFQLTIHHMYFFNSFWITYIMPETPRSVFLIMFGIVCVLAIRNGLETIARCCFLFTVIVWLTTFTLVVLLLGDMKLSYLLPVFGAPFIDFVHSTHIIATIPFGDLIIFLMIFPYVSDRQKLKKPVLAGISLATLQLVIIVLRDIVVLGPSVVNVASASFMTARQIDIADILTRMDILVAISLLITIFVKATLVYYVTVLATAQILNLRSYKPLAIPIGLLVVTIGATLYPSDMEQVYAANYAWPFYASINGVFLPVVTLIVIGIRSLAGRKKEIEAQ